MTEDYNTIVKQLNRLGEKQTGENPKEITVERSLKYYVDNYGKGEPGNTVWGTITGEIGNQTDLINAVDDMIADELADFEHVAYKVADSVPTPTEVVIGGVTVPTEEGVRYLVKHPTENIYEEYILIDGVIHDIGSTEEVDLSNYLQKTDVVDNLTSTDTDKPLSAKQGKELKTLVDKKPYYFDTVAEMKAYDLKDGDYAITKGYYSANDGGSAFYEIVDTVGSGIWQEELTNDLYANLIVTDQINVKQCGATNEDLSTVLNTLLLNTEKPIYIPKENFEIQETINITKDNTKIICDGNLSCTKDIKFINIVSSNCNLKFNGEIKGTTVSDNYVGTAISIGSSSKSVGHNNIFINKIDKVENGILMCPDGFRGVHYNITKFNFIRANYCIHFKAGDNNRPWINENVFYGGRVAGGVGVYTEKGLNQTDPYNGNKFINIGYENINTGINLNFARYNIFDRCRMSESLTGDYWIICSEIAQNNTFSIESQMQYNKINDTSEGINNKNIYNVNIANAGGEWLGSKAICSEGYFIIPKDDCLQPDKLIINGYDKDGVIDHIPVYTEEATLFIGASAGNKAINYILPKEVFNNKKIKKINICLAYRETTTTINIYDSDNNLIVSDAQFGTGKINKKWYILEWLYMPWGGYDKWRLREITTTGANS